MLSGGYKTVLVGDIYDHGEGNGCFIMIHKEIEWPVESFGKIEGENSRELENTERNQYLTIWHKSKIWCFINGKIN